MWLVLKCVYFPYEEDCTIFLRLPLFSIENNIIDMFVGENGAWLYEAKYCLARVKFSYSPGIINMFIMTNDLVIIKQYIKYILLRWEGISFRHFFLQGL